MGKLIIGLQKLRKKLFDLHGELAQQWFQRLPELQSKYEQQWGIRLLEPVPNLSYNLVYFAERLSDQQKVIFKTCVPNPDFSNEIKTLEYFAGHGCVAILEHDHTDGVMLIEQALPGSMLSVLTMQGLDEQAVYICADLINKLHADPAIVTSELRSIPKLSDRLSEYKSVRSKLEQNNLDFDLTAFNYAEQLFIELSSTTTETVVLHGDLHHFNILAATRNPWLAIDPQGIIGDPIFEIAAFMCNPYPMFVDLPNLKEILARRIEIFHDLLGYDKQRIRDWSIAHAVLAAGQNLTDHAEDWSEFLHIGKTLMTLEV